MNIDEMTEDLARGVKEPGTAGLGKYLGTQASASWLLALSVAVFLMWHLGLPYLFGGYADAALTAIVASFLFYVNVAKFMAWRALVGDGDLNGARRWIRSTEIVALLAGAAVLVL